MNCSFTLRNKMRGWPDEKYIFFNHPNTQSSERFGLPMEHLISVFVLYVRSVVEYATPVWHGSLTNDQSKNKTKRNKTKIFLCF